MPFTPELYAADLKSEVAENSIESGGANFSLMWMATTSVVTSYVVSLVILVLRAQRQNQQSIYLLKQNKKNNKNA